MMISQFLIKLQSSNLIYISSNLLFMVDFFDFVSLLSQFFIVVFNKKKNHNHSKMYSRIIVLALVLGSFMPAVADICDCSGPAVRTNSPGFHCCPAIKCIIAISSLRFRACAMFRCARARARMRVCQCVCAYMGAHVQLRSVYSPTVCLGCTTKTSISNPTNPLIFFLSFVVFVLRAGQYPRD